MGPNAVIVVGPPLSGKNLICRKLGYPSFDAGHVYRQTPFDIHHRDKVGYINRELSKFLTEHQQEPIVLLNYVPKNPVSINQFISVIMRTHTTVIRVIHLTAPEEVLISRGIGRQRGDSCDRESICKRIKNFNEYLLGVIKQFCSALDVPVSYISTNRAIEDIVSQVHLEGLCQHPMKSTIFLGALVANELKKNLSNFPKDDTHVVSFKLDGTRCLMLHEPNQPVKLVNRSMNIKHIGRCLADAKTAIYDTEIIITETKSEHIVILDVIWMEGCPVDLDLNSRLKLLDDMNLPYVENVMSTEVICRKRYYPMSETARLLSMSTNYPTDGLVMTSKHSYRVGADSRLFRWKPPHHQTCDLLYKDGTLRDKEGVVGNLPNQCIPNGTICEMRWNFRQSVWIFVRYRTDKNTPNSRLATDNARNSKVWVTKDDILNYLRSPAVVYDRQANVQTRENWAVRSSRGNFFIKRCIIAEMYTRLKNINMIDLGCGCSRDYGRFTHERVSGGCLIKYQGFDVSEDSIRIGSKKYRANETFSSKLLDMSEAVCNVDACSVNLIWVQMSFHYVCSSEQQVHDILTHMYRVLQDGGFVVITTIDSDVLEELVKCGQLSTPLYEFKIEESFNSKEFGTRYRFSLDGTVEDCNEYVVPKERFIDMAKEVGFRVDKTLSHNHRTLLQTSITTHHDRIRQENQLTDITESIIRLSELYYQYVFQKPSAEVSL